MLESSFGRFGRRRFNEFWFFPGEKVKAQTLARGREQGAAEQNFRHTADVDQRDVSVT